MTLTAKLGSRILLASLVVAPPGVALAAGRAVPLVEAVKAGDLATIRRLLKQPGAAKTATRRRHDAAARGDRPR